jgi:tRNA threonylcarbamoyladenosine biosynthesis protein TsaE
LKNATYLTHSAVETFELAYQWSEQMVNPTLLLLYGDLGMGKTVFAKGIAAGLDIDPQEVTSPTFTLINDYPNGRQRFIHLDLYRLPTNIDTAYSLGLEELLIQPAVILIEWADRLADFPLPTHYQITITGVGDNDTARQIVCKQVAGR